jgi:hypothetical protein
MYSGAQQRQRAGNFSDTLVKWSCIHSLCRNSNFFLFPLGFHLFGNTSARWQKISKCLFRQCGELPGRAAHQNRTIQTDTLWEWFRAGRNLGWRRVLRDRIHWRIFVGNLMSSWATISFSRKIRFLGVRSITLVRNNSLVIRVEINKLKSEIVFKWTGVYNWTYIIVTNFLTVPKWSNSNKKTKTFL